MNVYYHCHKKEGWKERRERRREKRREKEGKAGGKSSVLCKISQSLQALKNLAFIKLYVESLGVHPIE